MIDYFTKDELLHFQYLVLSAKVISLDGGTSEKLGDWEEVTNRGKVMNVQKLSSVFYPTSDTIIEYAETGNKEVFEKMYMNELFPKDNNDCLLTMYRSIIDPVVKHNDVIIINDMHENDIIDVFCKAIKKKFSLDTIDLNELFSKGSIEEMIIDINKVKDKSVDIRIMSAKEKEKLLEQTADGRLELLNMMNSFDKKRKLKKLGIKFNKNDDLDVLLTEAWVNDIGN
jgi:hypothetical protein